MVRFIYCLAVMIALVAAVMIAPPTVAFENSSAHSSHSVSASDLPPEARNTLALIRKGGPYPYAKDGTIFSNRERALPRQPRGYYHEYTVKTPGSRDRGARRVICGGKAQSECYYTDDHYASFRMIKE